jgi:polyisoprenoid-binding protein YceI
MTVKDLAPILLVVAPLVWRAPTGARSALETFAIEPSRSHAAVQVGKAGLLSFAAGHLHEISVPIDTGTVDVDPGDLTRSRIRLTIKASALAVVAKNEPPDDVPKVQDAMQGEKVLDAARYPTIAFESTAVNVKGRSGSTVDLSVAGRLTIRGVTQPVTAPVHLSLTQESLTATGSFVVKQTAFGITPISVARVVVVKDDLDIGFEIVAHRRQFP